MKTRHILTVLLAKSGGEIRGKTKMQKEMYFLAEVLQMDLAYRPHFYGPYSDEVGGGMDQLEGIGFVDMRREYLGREDQRGFEVHRCDFKLNKHGEEMASWLEHKYPEESQKIGEFIKKLSAVPGGANYMNISLAAKVHYILKRSNQPLTREEIREIAKELGWGNIEQRDIDGAANILETLGFMGN